MGRLTGFLGGTVLASSILYLGVLRLRQNTQQHREALRECSQRLEALRYPPRTPPNPRPRVERPSLKETLKDAWNEEIVGMARWVQRRDWVRMRESAEEGVGNLVEKVRR